MIIPENTAVTYTDNFRDATITPISIPLAWRFDKADLMTLIDTSTGYIRFYAGLRFNEEEEKYEMTLLAVATDAVNYGNDMIAEVAPLIYDFASPCPVACDTVNSPLLPPVGDAGRVAQEFTRV